MEQLLFNLNINTQPILDIDLQYIPIPILRRSIANPEAFIKTHGILSYINCTRANNDTEINNNIRIEQLLVNYHIND